MSTLELIKEYQTGNKDLLKDIVNENQALAYSLANRYKVTKKEEKEDLNQVAMLGLIKAIDNFDLSFNVNFSTYAVPIILGEIKKHFREISFLKVSRNLKDLYYDIEKVKKDYLNEHHKEVTLSELESIMGMSRYDLVLAMESSNAPLSLEQEYETRKDGDVSLDQMIGDSKENNLINFLTLNDAINTLNEKEKLLINLRFYKDYSQKEVADKFNVSQVQVSRIERQVIEKLKKFF